MAADKAYKKVFGAGPGPHVKHAACDCEGFEGFPIREVEDPILGICYEKCSIRHDETMNTLLCAAYIDIVSMNSHIERYGRLRQCRSFWPRFKYIGGTARAPQQAAQIVVLNTDR